MIALAVASLRVEGETKIGGAQYIGVTFPNFVELMKGLGAKMSTSE